MGGLQSCGVASYAYSVTDLCAYIDETGDPGGSDQSSPIFGMAAVIVSRVGSVQLLDAINELRAEFSIPRDVPLSWKAHLRTHEKRKYVAQVLARVQELKVVYVYCRKSDVTLGNFTHDRALFYNYVAGKTYKGILWAANHWDGRPARLWTRFGQVMGLDHQTTTRPYFDAQISAAVNVPNHIEQGLRWVAATTYRESEAADLYAGFVKAATWPDKYGNVEGSYLRRIWHQIRNSEACAIPLGLMSIPENRLVTNHDWFPCRTCRQKRTG